jgi:AcrR family transcriptional regulator
VRKGLHHRRELIGRFFQGTSACNHLCVARQYRLKARAERQEQTRRRIVEAAVELHSTVGPVGTTVSAIAERAGVQRHTYYRYFPDEWSLRLACSARHDERQPFPNPAGWAEIADPAKRLRRGLGELYGYYERNESLLAHVARDAEVDPLTREIVELRFTPRMAAVRAALAPSLGGGNRRRALAALDLALDFHTWRSLARRSGLSRPQAVELMVTVLT